jgi:hypothetical protein
MAGTAALLPLVLLLLVHASAGAADCYFPAVFNFGDSNSDTGGLSAAFGAAPPPNGMTFFGSPAGRYCDGRLVVDFIGTRVPKFHYSLARTTPSFIRYYSESPSEAHRVTAVHTLIIICVWTFTIHLFGSICSSGCTVAGPMG